MDKEYQRKQRKWLFDRVNSLAKEVNCLGGILQNPVDNIDLDVRIEWNNMAVGIISRLDEWRKDVQSFVLDNSKNKK